MINNHPKGIKSLIMKTLAYCTGAFFLSATLLGMMFKILHWPGAGILLVSGVAGLSLIAIPINAVRFFKTAK